MYKQDDDDAVKCSLGAVDYKSLGLGVEEE
jgi:hypothetical protein